MDSDGFCRDFDGFCRDFDGFYRDFSGFYKDFYGFYRDFTWILVDSGNCESGNCESGNFCLNLYLTTSGLLPNVAPNSFIFHTSLNFFSSLVLKVVVLFLQLLELSCQPLILLSQITVLIFIFLITLLYSFVS